MPTSRERADHLGDRVEQRLQLVGAAGVEGDDPAQVLVEADRLAVRLTTSTRPWPLPKVTSPWKTSSPVRVTTTLHVRGAVEELTQRLGPGEEPAPAVADPVAVQPEGHDPPAVEEDVEDGLLPGQGPDAVGVDGHLADPVQEPESREALEGGAHGPRL